MNDLSSLILKAKIQDNKRETNFLLHAERIFFQQKMKNKHLMLAETSTSYFHSLVMKRNSASIIPSLMVVIQLVKKRLSRNSLIAMIIC